MPKVSVFTPSHDPKYLDECYESLKAQHFTDWEWVVLLNGGAEWSPSDRVDGSRGDERVKVFLAPDGVSGIGAMKALACEFAEGEILVELDHDDMLTSQALGLVVQAFESFPEASLAYSSYTQMNEDGLPNYDRFDPSHGWEYDKYPLPTTKGVQYCQVPRNMPAFPHAVSYIWYAPNHVRAFKKSTYEAVGGYDTSLAVADDHDLMCRLFIAGGFVEINDCLYFQRIHDGNSQSEQDSNALIQTETVRIHDKYIERMALAWSNRNGLAALDLGAAHNPAPGFKSLDMQGDVDIQCDITQGIPLPDSSVGVIRAYDFLEHIPDKVALFNELYRVLAHGGMILSVTPSTDGRGAFQDPTHVAFYNENSFWYFTDANFAKYVPEIKCRFQATRLVTYFPNAWHQQHNISYVCANLTAIKDGDRIAGVINI